MDLYKIINEINVVIPNIKEEPKLNAKIVMSELNLYFYKRIFHFATDAAPASEGHPSRG